MHNVKVIKENNKATNSTDMDLLVESYSAEEVTSWSKERVAESLIAEAGLEKEKAENIATIIEERIVQLKLARISTSLVRELVNHELLERGETRRLKRYQDISIPLLDIELFIFQKSNSNANINVNNPESTAFFLSENLTKKYALRRVFTQEVTQAHLNGKIYIHDLGMVTRLYCFGGNIIEYIKKYGLVDLDSLSTKSFPARAASTLIGHINTFLSIIQAYFAGALGMGFVNIFFAPYLRGMSKTEVYNLAQYFIFSLSQNCFSRGAQVLFVDLNLHFGVPDVMKDIPAIGSNGEYMVEVKYAVDKDDKGVERGLSFTETFSVSNLNSYEEEIWERFKAKQNSAFSLYANQIKSSKDFSYRILTYKDFEEEAQTFLDVILQLYEEGDKQGSFFYFPKIDLHVDEKTFSDSVQRELFQKACKTASVNGTPYFIFDRGSSTTLSQCCRLRAEIDKEELTKSPESVRFCAVQNITINLPQAAYRAGKDNFDKFIEEIHKTMDIARRAHEQKIRFMKKEIQEGAPLYTIGKLWQDGKPWVALDKTTRIIGILGLNEAMQYLYGKQLHEGDDVYKKGLKTIAHMYQKCQEYEKETGVSFKLEETPAESLAYRAAKTDLQYYPEQAKEVVKGDLTTGSVYYTNSVHFSVDSPVSIIERVQKQSAFHVLVKSGSIVHAWVGENLPDPVSLLNFIEKIYVNTQCDQFTISPNLTICLDCRQRVTGLHDKCVHCGSVKVNQVSRVTGYFSLIKNWNAGKQAELVDRKKGSYSV